MTPRRLLSLLLALLCTALLASCNTGTTEHGARALDNTAVPSTIRVGVQGITNGSTIPRENTCDGAGAAPTISWGAVPAATKSVAVVVDDPDAPSGTFVHWLVTGLPASAGSVPSTARGVHQLDNSAGTNGWTPPCPPAGSTHHYRFTVYALRDYVCAATGDDAPTPDCSPPAAADGLSQIADAAIAKGAVTATYGR